MNRQALVVGASRGLGLVLLDELLRRGWRVVATTRGNSGELEARADVLQGRLSVQRLEMTDPAQAPRAHQGDLQSAFEEYETRQRPYVTRAQAIAGPGGDLIVPATQQNLDARNERLCNLAAAESQKAPGRYSHP